MKRRRIQGSFQNPNPHPHCSHLFRVILHTQSQYQKRQDEPCAHDRGYDMGRENDGKLVDELACLGRQEVHDPL